MKLPAIMVTIMLLFPYAVLASEIYNKDFLVIDLSISSPVKIKELSDDAILKELSINLSFFPKDDVTQKVVSTKTTPTANLLDSTLLFRWEEPAQDEFLFNVTSRVRTYYYPTMIKEKIPFPVREIPPELRKYTLPSETIDSDNEDIIRLASRLAEGEDDLFVVAYKIGEWTRGNVEYSLDTLTADVTQKASWVLKNRRGVCDEITNLFIAMVRSLGIPARFVSGISYTESGLFPNHWGPHGWAEVYFPGYGWVAFDVTFGELGYIDPTHIKLKDAVDSQKPATQYFWKGRNVDIITSPLEFRANIAEQGTKQPFPFSLSIKPLKQEMGFGSYNLLEVEVENHEDFYIAREILISTPKELHVFDSEKKTDVLLRPNEKKSIYFVAKAEQELDSNYIYTMPIKAYTTDNNTAKGSVAVGQEYNAYSEDFVKEVLGSIQESEKKTYSRKVALECAHNGSNISCSVSNMGNIILSGVAVCLKEDCTKIDLGISQEKAVEFNVPEKKAGSYEYLVVASNDDVTVSSLVPVVIYDEPEIVIPGIKYPTTATIENDFPISISLQKKSFSDPLNITMVVTNGVFARTWEFKQLGKNETFDFIFSGRNLGFGKNTFTILVSYQDSKAEQYTLKRTFEIENATPLLNVENIQHLLTETPWGAAFIVALISLVMFLVIAFLILRGDNKYR